MQTVNIPYGLGHIRIGIPAARLKAVLFSGIHEYKPEGGPNELVKAALENPIRSERLAALARGKNGVVLVASDHTRPVPSKVIIPAMLDEIRSGNPQADITILIATGCHRKPTREELVEKFGAETVSREKIVIHDCGDADMIATLGELPSGGKLAVNKLVAEADLVVSEGFIEPHFFAGFSGGRKSIMPGTAARETVLYNHNAAFIDDPRARTGVTAGNPVHRDMLYAAKKAGLAFIVNVVINADKEIVAAVAGDYEKAHEAGCKFLLEQCAVTGKESDIVVASNGGHPLDQNIYQAVKGMTAAEAVVKKNGVIIFFARSGDGHGGEDFYNTFRAESDPDKILATIRRTPATETIPDQWQSQIFARVLSHARVIYISDAPDEMVRDMHMYPALHFAQALEMADAMLGCSDGSITVIPDGVSVIARRFPENT